jgi:DNA-binding transcriptional LysR family regulator
MVLVMELRSLRYFVAVAEELHFGRAAARLHMTQPPLSRAIKQLEADLGAVLLLRSAAGVTLTPAGAALYDEARALLARAEQARARVADAAGPATLTIGTLADSAEQAGARLTAEFRRRHPAVQVRVREAELTDPTAGLRAGLVDVALTRAPFDETGISVHVLRADDPLAGRDQVSLDDLAGRPWFRLPDGTDPAWQAYWNAVPPGGPLRDGPVIRTVQECVQAALWNGDGTIGLTPLAHALPDGLTVVPLAGLPPSRLVVAWNTASTSPLIRSFTGIAAAIFARMTNIFAAPAGVGYGPGHGT